MLLRFRPTASRVWPVDWFHPGSIQSPGNGLYDHDHHAPAMTTVQSTRSAVPCGPDFTSRGCPVNQAQGGPLRQAVARSPLPQRLEGVLHRCGPPPQRQTRHRGRVGGWNGSSTALAIGGLRLVQRRCGPILCEKAWTAQETKVGKQRPAVDPLGRINRDTRSNARREDGRTHAVPGRSHADMGRLPTFRIAWARGFSRPPAPSGP